MSISTPDRPVEQGSRSRLAEWRRFAVAELGALAGLALLCLVLSLLSDRFWSVSNLSNIPQQIAVISVMAVGMTFVIISGGIDLSVGSMVAFAGLVMAILMKQLHFPVWPTIGIGLLVGCGIGFLNGFMVSLMRLPPFIATLAMMYIARGAAFTISGGQPVYSLPEPFLAISGRWGNVHIPAVIMIAVFVLGWLVLKYTKLGRYTYAIGGNETASVLSGIGVKAYKTIIYTLSGLTCGTAAVLLTARLDSAVPVAADGYELDAIAAVVVGGTSLMGGEGKIFGTLIGALIIGVVNNGLNLLYVPQGPQKMIKGVIIILAVWVDMLTKRGRR